MWHSPEFWSVVVSVIALAFSISSSKKSQKWLKTNKEYEMSRNIYSNFLTKELPKAFYTFIESKDWKKAAPEFINEFKNFRKQIYYFKYSHPKIYGEILEVLNQIDSLVANAAVINPTEKTQKETIENNIANKFDELYTIFLIKLPNDRLD